MSDSQQRSAYRQIFKATSLFGGVQVFNILIGIVRVKFVAILLGATGVGIMSLLNAPLQLILSVSGFGIALSSVRDISDAQNTNHPEKLAKIVIILRRWSMISGLLGSLVTLVCARLLSKWSFGNDEYTWAFVWLSMTIFLLTVSKGQSAVLQGLRKLTALAKSGMIGSVVGLLTSLPLYYMWGVKGIVPAMILSAIVTLVLTWYFVRQIRLEKVELTVNETYRGGLGMAKLGIFMTISGFWTTLLNYVLSSYISQKGGVAEVGLYNAGLGVVAQYTGLVFTAMGTDYYPRLSAVNNDIVKIKELVKQQAETALYIITPLLSLLIITMPFVIKILYTSAFLPVIMFANLSVLGMQFKTVTWAMGYIYLAKGAGRIFLITEIITGIFFLMTNIIGYQYLGLTGLGVSFVINYLIGMIFTYFILKRKFEFSYSYEVYKILGITFIFTVVSFFTIYIDSIYLRYGFGLLIFILTSLYSIRELNKFLDIKSIVVNFVKKKLNS